jgi:hypothetical protein
MNTKRITLCATAIALLMCAVVVAQDQPKFMPKATTEATINGK